MTRVLGSVAPPVRVRRGEQGGGTVLTLVLVCCVFVAGGVGVWAAGWMGSLRHSAQAADLAALAAASARVRADDACDAARRVATANGAAVTRCTVRGDLRDFAVDVEVRARLRPRLAGGPQWAIGRASAGSMPR